MIQKNHARVVSPCSLSSYANHPALSASLIRSAYRFQGAFLKREWDRRRFSQQDSLGSLIHEAFLESLNLDNLVVIPARLESSQPQWRKKKAAFMSEHLSQGHRVVSESLVDGVRRGINALEGSDEACRIREDCEAEQTIYWLDENFKVECKARLDLMGMDQVWDLKCLRGCSRSKVMRTAKSGMGLDLQLIWYERAMSAVSRSVKTLGHILLDTSHWVVEVKPMSDESRHKAEELVLKALTQWKRLLDSMNQEK